MRQLIYSVDSTSADIISSLAKQRSSEAEFILINSPRLAIFHFLKLIKRFKFSVELIKLLIKLLSKRNHLYAVIYQGNIVSEGLVSYGVCNHYKVDKNDCIIGPVNTNTNYQGKGFATFGLTSCLRFIFENKVCNKIFIDTREDNFAMQKVIEKSGFNKAQSSYNRT